MTELSLIKELCQLENPYQKPAHYTELFLKAMQQNIEWHFERNSFYRQFVKTPRFSSLEEIPFIHAHFFKQYESVSIPAEDVYLHLTSSGTTGQKSQVFFDEWSISIAQTMVDKIFKYYHWVDSEPVNYLLYTYEPERNSKLGTAYTDNFLCKYAPIREVFYAIKNVGGGEHRFDLFGTIDFLDKSAREGIPVRIFGFPSYLYFTLEHREKRGMENLNLPKNSLVFLGGGWKGLQNRSIPKNELYSMANKQLGIPDSRLRDGFGSVEHCIPYIECSEHKFHVPIWSQVFIRNVKSLKLNSYEEPGLLQLMSPYITSMPANNVLMGDLAALYPGENCACELDTPYFEILGRAGTSNSKSCAIAANDILGRGL